MKMCIRDRSYAFTARQDVVSRYYKLKFDLTCAEGTISEQSVFLKTDVKEENQNQQDPGQQNPDPVSYTHLDVYKRQAMTLAEILNIFPIFIRRVKLLRAIPYIIAGIAFGKGIGSLIYFWKGWG